MTIKTDNLTTTIAHKLRLPWGIPFLRPRWKKVLGDLWSYKTRTLLVVLSIFVGVFAVGVIGGAQTTLSQEMTQAYEATNPAHAIISVSEQDGLTDSLVESIRDMDGIASAEAQTTISAKAYLGTDRWLDMQIIAIPDYEEMAIESFEAIVGTFPPPDKTIMIERSGLGLGEGKVNASVGDTILIERPDGKQRIIRISGAVRDLAQPPSSLANMATGYISFETLQWLGASHTYTQLQLRFTGDTTNYDHNKALARTVYDKIQKSGRNPSFPQVSQPGQHWATSFVSGISALMGMLAVLAIILGGFLVTNTIAALLAQQTRQIGILKSIGARPRQIMGLYLVLVLCFGLLAFSFALLLTPLAVRGFVGVVMGFFNFDPPATIQVPIGVFVIQAIVSLLVPMVASLLPIWQGTRVTIRQALDSGGIQQNVSKGWISRTIGQPIAAKMRQMTSSLSRPILLSLRNTVRRKGRVTLTLITLTLGGGVFMAVFSVNASLNYTLDALLDSLNDFDMMVQLERPERATYVTRKVEQVPGVESAEGWIATMTRRVYPDTSEGTSFQLIGVPPETTMMHPTMVAGRWLLPEDENALVVSVDVMKNNPDLSIGDEIILALDGKENRWIIVGIMVTMQGMENAYTPFAHYGRVTGDVDHTQMVMVKTTHPEEAFVTAVGKRLEEYLKRNSLGVGGLTYTYENRAMTQGFFSIIIGALMAMALVIAAVGGLGLAGTMSLNVIERTREIGVLRAIGASNSRVLQVIMLEGLFLGILSWLLAAALSFPVSQLLIDTVGSTLFGISLTFAFSTIGLWIWLGMVLVLAAGASMLPAWNASRVSVRAVLAHE